MKLQILKGHRKLLAPTKPTIQLQAVRLKRATRQPCAVEERAKKAYLIISQGQKGYLTISLG